MSLTGKEGAAISLDEARTMIGRYRKKYATKEGSSEPSNRIFCFMGRENIEKLLAQEDCVGIRTYFAEAEDGMIDIVLVGADRKGNDITTLTVDRGGGSPPERFDSAVSILQ